MNVVRFEPRRESVGMGHPWIGTDVLIDGELVSHEGVGPDPEDLIRELEAPIPAAVRVRVCSCGFQECWSLAVTVRQDQGAVIWGDWRDGTTEGGGTFPSEPVERPVLRFRLGQYSAAVEELRSLSRGWNARDV
ncbi:MAG TPA: hypothetical protein VEH79_00030 [Gaiellaceae bacterium]|nr:hypothetical protein [Gaiellaceae bacterium]